MKHLLIAILMLLPLAALAQSDYVICEMQGSVAVKRSGQKSWTTGRAYMPVDWQDTIRLGANSHARIHCKRTNRVYKCYDKGSISVGDLIAIDETSSNSAFAKMNNMVFGRRRQQPSRSSASSSRQVNGTRNPYRALYAYLQYCADHTDQLSSDAIAIEKVSMGHDGFGIRVTNQSSDTLFCNMVHMTDGRMHLCYFFEEDIDLLPLAPGATADLTAYTLFADSQYLFFAAKEDMSILSLDELFEYQPSDQALPDQGDGFVVVKP